MKIAKKMPPKGLEMYILGFVSYSTVTKTGGLSMVVLYDIAPLFHCKARILK
jgi:hypothetical protein